MNWYVLLLVTQECLATRQIQIDIVLLDWYSMCLELSSFGPQYNVSVLAFLEKGEADDEMH